MRFTTACENDELQPLKIVHQSAEGGPVWICKILIRVVVLDWLDSKGVGPGGVAHDSQEAPPFDHGALLYNKTSS